jgi:hypothetical protein
MILFVPTQRPGRSVSTPGPDWATSRGMPTSLGHRELTPHKAGQPAAQARRQSAGGHCQHRSDGRRGGFGPALSLGEQRDNHRRVVGALLIDRHANDEPQGKHRQSDQHRPPPGMRARQSAHRVALMKFGSLPALFVRGVVRRYDADGGGKLLILSFKILLFRRSRRDRPHKSGGPPLFELSLKVQRNVAHNQLRVCGPAPADGLSTYTVL